MQEDLTEDSLERAITEMREKLGDQKIVLHPTRWFLSDPPELIKWADAQDPNVWVSEGR